MKKELVLASIVAISLGGVMLVMAENSNKNQGDSQNPDDKNINCGQLCADAPTDTPCLYTCTYPTIDVIHCDTDEDGINDCWCEVGSTACLLPLEDVDE
ncbi:MAG: hypothetical protein LUQ47_02930 [Methanotrichaceae archaeon]|nr:hypothetical protein [Methanotrichaceae archaeon]